jgi:aerobic-type carbon monoxide dehydrogenase small subunit (CoxS/CutS family)
MSVLITVDGRQVVTEPGRSVAAALLAAGYRTFRRTATGDAPRAVFCGMGSCYDCLAVVDDVAARTCLTPVSDGMRIDTTEGGEQR